MNHTRTDARREQSILQGVAPSCTAMHADAPLAAATACERTAPPGCSPPERSGSQVGGPLGLSMSHISPGAFGTPCKGYWLEGIRREEREWIAKRTKAHIEHVEDQRANEASIRWYQGSEFIKIKSLAMHASQVGGGVRGKVKAFTSASRKRMLDFLRSLNRDTCKLPLFVTLTYPGQYPEEPQKWKRDLDTFKKALRRRYPAAWGPWKLEPQRRGAPHFHLLVFGVDRIGKAWLSNTWYRIVGSGDERHLRAGTQVAKIASWRGVTSYAAKYMGKELDWLPAEWSEGVGRWWGIHNRKASQAHLVLQQIRLNLPMMHVIRRILRKRLAKALKPTPGGRRFLRRIKRMRQGQGMTFHLPTGMMERLWLWTIFKNAQSPFFD